MIEFEQLALIVAGIIIIVQQFYAQKSVPLDKVSPLIKELRAIVLATPNKIDDFLLDTAEDLVKRVETVEINEPDAVEIKS